jgi:hypothetical protein
MRSLVKYRVKKIIIHTAFIMPVIFLIFISVESGFAQLIAHVQPDALGPGMTIAMEVLAPAADTGAFGSDGVYLPNAKILLQNQADSLRVTFGPVVISWNGRVLQVPVMAKATAVTGSIHFQILTGNKKSSLAAFEIAQPHSKLADEIELSGPDIFSKGLFNFSTAITDSTVSGNPHYHPVTILSRGPIHLSSAEITVSADGLSGGPGGGGGGAGFAGTGGAGYTGGGSDSDYSPANVGSGANSTQNFGGASSTGISGGASSFIAPNIDQGGGGGTGCPYGSSGIFSGGNDTSQVGGFGGASAGGETVGTSFGGGGGAFATDGANGAGVGDNGGKTYGGRFLIPLQGGSGGGAGNHVSELDSSAGSGGGGGGALTLISFDTLSISNSFVTANGANGTSGINAVDAGGGGGSGGGLILSGRNGITLSNATISTNKGSGGKGGAGVEQISKGGSGGIGRIRIDGDTLQNNVFFTGVSSSGPTLAIPPVKLAGPIAAISGTAGDSLSLTDSVRVYYRNQHSAWRFLDTVRFRNGNGSLHWQAFIPVGHDSSLFITAMAQVRNPHRSFANFEPERLLSHLSSGIMSVVATPHLVLEQDTLIFGCYKIGDTCVNANFYLSNWGEDSLHIKSITISNTNFTVTPKDTDLGYYNSDSITITYCPHTVGKDTATITFISNDTTRTAILIGCGIDKDTRITLKPTSLDFGRVHVGSCDTLSVIAHSIGKDSALVNLTGLIHPPFEVIKPLKDSLLAPKDSLKILISFCPTDTGKFHSSFIFSEKRDSVIVSGLGSETKKILVAPADLQVKPLCMNTCDTMTIRLSSVGNDAVIIDSVSGVTFNKNVFPVTIPPQTDTSFKIQYCITRKGDDSIVIHYYSDADSSNETILHYHGIQASFVADSALHFGSICLPATDSLPFFLHRAGSDRITIDSLKLETGAEFSLSSFTIPKIDSIANIIHFIPHISGIYKDELLVYLHAGSCGDSLVKIPIDGSASNGSILFSKSVISFGSIDTGSCKEDSIPITSVCPATILFPSVQPPYSIVSPSGNTLTFNAGETKNIVYRYCPTLVGRDSSFHIFSLPNGVKDTITLAGSGQSIIDSPFVRFTLEKVTATAGQEFSYLIGVDSISSGTDIKSLSGSLHYDPTLIKPLNMTGIIWKIFNNSETIPGTYEFSASNAQSLTVGAFATLQMLPLYSDHDTTSVFLDNIALTNYASTRVISGFINVVHCGNLPGHILVAGVYALGNPTPNPGSGNISFPVTLGNDGILHIRMYNPSGMTEIDRSINGKRGENTIVLDVATLSSGVYYLSADSWGWHDGKTIIIQK